MPVRVDPADWKRVLAKVTGRFVRGQHRVSTRELLERLGVPIPASDKSVKQLRPIMHELGWHGPQMLRFDRKTLNGYWRLPTVGGSSRPMWMMLTAGRSSTCLPRTRLSLTLSAT